MAEAKLSLEQMAGFKHDLAHYVNKHVSIYVEQTKYTLNGIVCGCEINYSERWIRIEISNRYFQGHPIKWIYFDDKNKWRIVLKDTALGLETEMVVKPYFQKS